jgi:hypothetical protein
MRRGAALGGSQAGRAGEAMGSMTFAVKRGKQMTRTFIWGFSKPGSRQWAGGHAERSESSRTDPLAFARRLRKLSSEFNNWKEVIQCRVRPWRWWWTADAGPAVREQPLSRLDAPGASDPPDAGPAVREQPLSRLDAPGASDPRPPNHLNSHGRPRQRGLLCFENHIMGHHSTVDRRRWVPAMAEPNRQQAWTLPGRGPYPEPTSNL